MNFKNKTDKDLISQASQADSDTENSFGLIDRRTKEGRGAMAELTRRLKDSIENLNKTTSLYSKIIIGLTIVMLIGLVIQIWLAYPQNLTAQDQLDRNERDAKNFCTNNLKGEWPIIGGGMMSCSEVLEKYKKLEK